MRTNKKILVVDDNPINLAILEEILSDTYRLAFARTGQDALREAERFQPAVVLLDVMMPGMDGLDTCRQLRHTAGLGDTVIIMLSAKAMPSEQAAGLRAGADDYITKPLDADELLGLLRRYIRPDAEFGVKVDVDTNHEPEGLPCADVSGSEASR